MPDQEAPPINSPALGVSYQARLDREGVRSIVFQTHVDQETPAAVVNALLDKLALAVDRQMAKTELVELAQEEQELHKRIATFNASFSSMEVQSQQRWAESNKKGAWDPDKLPPQERTARTNLKNGLEQDKERLIRLRARVQALQKVVDGNGSDASPSEGIARL